MLRGARKRGGWIKGLELRLWALGLGFLDVCLQLGLGFGFCFDIVKPRVGSQVNFRLAEGTGP